MNKEEHTEQSEQQKPQEQKQAPKKQEKKVHQPEQTFTGFVHIDTFLSTAQVMFEMTQTQVEGFKAYMYGKFYQNDERDFIPYLETYLGRKINL